MPIVDIRAKTVADAFFSGWIACYGTPATITTDRGTQFESKLWDSLCNQFGIIRNRTTSYHPQSNGMVERFHRQLKAAIMAHESPNPWTIMLPAVLLGVRSAVKERLGRSAAEMIYGTTLRLPGEFTKQYTVDANTDLEKYSDKLHLECEPTTGTNIQRKSQINYRARRLPGSLVGIHRVHLGLVVRTLRRPTGRVLKRKSRRQSEAVKNWPQSQSN